MGPKSVVNLRNRGVSFKCDICGVKLMTEDILVAHQRTAHNVVTKRQKRSQEASKPMKPVVSLLKDTWEEYSEEKNASTFDTMQATRTTKNVAKTVEFECPKCFKRFPTYFPALKHIQKYHNDDTQNEGATADLQGKHFKSAQKKELSVGPPNHPSMITPVRVELCTKCMCKVRSIQTHVCAGAKPGSVPGQVVCAACLETFSTIKVFDFHVVTFHGGPIESMFFPTNTEFTRWKTEMEQQTKASYTLRDQYEVKNKRYYHCNRVVHKDQICPSTLVIQELPKGVQVHFYHQHYKHDSIPYKLPQKYSKYSIMTFLKQAEDYSSLGQLQSDEDDLYMQFKTLMEGIIVDAAKLNIQTLKIILGKALEITSILTNYDEEMDDITTIPSRPSQRRALSDTEIVQALEEPLAKQKTNETTKTITDTTTKTTDTTSNDNLLDVNLAKRKSEVASGPEIKRAKTNINEFKDASPKIINAFSLADTKAKDAKQKTVIEQLVVTKIETNKVDNKNETNTKTNGDDAPSSFNDSYKSFVVKNFPSTESIASRTRSKPQFKTQIGQFKPNIIKGNARTKNLLKDDEKTKTINNNNKNDGQTKSVNINDVITKSILKSYANKNDDKLKKVTIIDEKTNKAEPVQTKPDYRTRSSALNKTNETTKTIPVKNTSGKHKSIKVVEITTKPVLKSDVGDKEKTLTRAKIKGQTNRISRSSLDKPKIDFEYEVKEQPDDVNILILKI